MARALSYVLRILLVILFVISGCCDSVVGAAARGGAGRERVKDEEEVVEKPLNKRAILKHTDIVKGTNAVRINLLSSLVGSSSRKLVENDCETVYCYMYKERGSGSRLDTCLIDENNPHCGPCNTAINSCTNPPPPLRPTPTCKDRPCYTDNMCVFDDLECGKCSDDLHCLEHDDCDVEPHCDSDEPCHEVGCGDCVAGVCQPPP